MKEIIPCESEIKAGAYKPIPKAEKDNHRDTIFYVGKIPSNPPTRQPLPECIPVFHTKYTQDPLNGELYDAIPPRENHLVFTAIGGRDLKVVYEDGAYKVKGVPIGGIDLLQALFTGSPNTAYSLELEVSNVNVRYYADVTKPAIFYTNIADKDAFLKDNRSVYNKKYSYVDLPTAKGTKTITLNFNTDDTGMGYITIYLTGAYNDFETGYVIRGLKDSTTGDTLDYSGWYIGRYLTCEGQPASEEVTDYLWEKIEQDREDEIEETLV